MKPKLLLHGGAGNFDKNTMSSDEYSIRLETMREALKIGYAILERGGNSLDATVETVVHLENSTYFNAGKSGALTWNGVAELDASLMDGATKNAGCVSNVTHIKNPILLAREILNSEHVFLTGFGAEEFALQRGVEFVSQNYFITEENLSDLERVKKANKVILGTVGAVALDIHGQLASSTSTGGIMNKRPGRVGDTPIIGAGTYADSTIGAISATGHGEYFIRSVAAFSIITRMQYLHEDINLATKEVLNQILSMGGTGGIIGITPLGDMTLEYTTPGMQRGFVDENEILVGIFEEME
ncbi:MAG: isoaspartyl peptidase/L-asparaginase [Candidatus Kapabacteria bacterium]|jgi:beta-aspartyl-peptidase (threonine type)|nr:isoaspartyl peptidase/L-asparaginase [Candidatus Kapabacteria bacterium]